MLLSFVRMRLFNCCTAGPIVTWVMVLVEKTSQQQQKNAGEWAGKADS